jgi:hypothetical protein
MIHTKDDIRFHLCTYMSMMAGKFWGFLSKKKMGGDPGVYSWHSSDHQAHDQLQQRKMENVVINNLVFSQSSVFQRSKNQESLIRFKDFPECGLHS